jgi:hypothetical protein
MTARLAHSSASHSVADADADAADAATRERALALLNKAHLGCEYALMLGLNKAEAAAFLAAAAALEPALTHLGARAAAARRAGARAASIAHNAHKPNHLFASCL